MFPRYWIGVVSESHVKIGVAGAFAQLCHGKSAPLARMKQGDVLIYYSPKTDMANGSPLQSFTAIGRIVGFAPYLFKMSEQFTPYRLDVVYETCTSAPIKPLLTHLSFIKNIQRWGYPFRSGHFEISQADFLTISTAMGVAHESI